MFFYELHEGDDDVFSDLLLVSAAPLHAPRAYFDLLAECGIDMVDLMLADESDLDLIAAERFLAEIAPDYA